MSVLDKIKKYYSSYQYVSNSLLKMLLTEPLMVKLKLEGHDIDREETRYLRIGSALDCILTSPELWDKEFEIADVKRPYGLMGKFVEALPDGITQDSDEEKYQGAYDEAGYKISIDRVIKYFWDNDEAVKYYNILQSLDLSKASKVLLFKDEWQIVKNTKRLIYANPFTMSYFTNGDDNEELVHQLDIYYQLEGWDCKSLLDGVKLNHKYKTIQPFDLKTSSWGVYNFHRPFIKFGYFRQASMYSKAIEIWAKENNYDNYSILPFQFIVVDSRSDSNVSPIIYQTTQNDIDVGWSGGHLRKDPDTRQKGVGELLHDLHWHYETGVWTCPRDLYESKGVRDLDVFL